MENVMVRISLFQSHPIHFLRKSVGWFLYNGSIVLNGKVDAFFDMNHCSVLALEVPGFSKGLLPP